MVEKQKKDRAKILNDAINEWTEDMKKRPFYHAFKFLINIIIVFTIMYSIGYTQQHAQYCDITVKELPERPTNFLYTAPEGLIEEIPPTNKSYAFYVDYYKDGYKPPEVGYNCTWDLKRFWGEITN